MLFFAALAASAAVDGNTQELTVRVRVAAGESALRFTTTSGAAVVTPNGAVAVPAGPSELVLQEAEPPEIRYHLVSKTFLPDEPEAQAAYLSELEAGGFDAEVLVQGRRFETAAGKTVDNRMMLVSIQRHRTQAEADRAKKKLEARSIWCYVVPEVIEPGTGTIRIEGAGTFGLPATLVADAAMELLGVNTGYWREHRTDQRYVGTIDVEIDPDGKLMLVENVSLESYLHGVLPAEMPDEWPLETLKAQAIAARSEVLASLAGKHRFDGYDFCGTEHCRAYLGSANGKARTDRALEDTRGRFLVHGDRVVTTVFSATCGGWTEDNDAIWSGRAQPALRGIADAPDGGERTSPRAMGVWKWLDQPSDAYCRADETYFRWRRSFTATELTAIVNQSVNVGRVKRIEMGERGVSGRLKSVKIEGASGARMVYKELTIRRTFGGLPSALFVVSTSQSRAGETVFTFVGAGRGHGVGLCQNGARGMAAAGLLCDQILTHYFSGAEVERFEWM